MADSSDLEKNVHDAATSFIRAFGKDIHDSETTQRNNPRIERACFGHKETIFGATFSPCGRLLATASQDSNVRIWNVSSNSCLTTIKDHDSGFECLRVTWAESSSWGKVQLPKIDEKVDDKNVFILASSGADGVVKLWRLIVKEGEDNKLSISKLECLTTIDHSLRDGDGESLEIPDVDKPQVYALQFINQWMSLNNEDNDSDDEEIQDMIITSADDEIHLWEPEKVHLSNGTTRMRCNRVLTFHFTSHQRGFGGVFVRLPHELEIPLFPDEKDSDGDEDNAERVFGGVNRNPKRKIFVFDAAHCPRNHLLAVSLADGSTRVVNGRGVCVAILELPGCNSHLTAVAWDSSGTRIATSVATGHVILWKLEGDGRSRYYPSCTAILQGGHAPGRPLYGIRYCGSVDQELLLSWGIDGRLCLWNSYGKGHLSPLAILVDKEDYPIYAVDLSATISKKGTKEDKKRLVVGGGAEGGFIGIAAYLYDIPWSDTQNQS